MRTYDPQLVVTSFNGLTIDGYGPDTIIKVSRNEDGWSYQPSNSGRGARSRNPNKSGIIEITLIRSAPANAYLSAIAVADELRGTGVGDFLVKDLTTSSALCESRNTWIKKFPDWERAKEIETVTWILESDEISLKFDGTIDA